VAEVAAEVESAPPESLPIIEPLSVAASFLTPEESAVFSEPYIPEEEPSQPSPEPTSHWPLADDEPSE